MIRCYESTKTIHGVLKPSRIICNGIIWGPTRNAPIRPLIVIGFIGQACCNRMPWNLRSEPNDKPVRVVVDRLFGSGTMPGRWFRGASWIIRPVPSRLGLRCAELLRLRCRICLRVNRIRCGIGLAVWIKFPIVGNASPPILGI